MPTFIGTSTARDPAGLTSVRETKKLKNKQTTNNRQLCIGTSTARDPWIQLGVVFIAWFNNQLEENEPMLEILGLLKDRNQTMIKGGLLKNKLEAIETSERMSTK